VNKRTGDIISPHHISIMGVIQKKADMSGWALTRQLGFVDWQSLPPEMIQTRPGAVALTNDGLTILKFSQSLEQK